jgi:N-methylhydantoinase A
VVDDGALRPSRNPGTRPVCFEADQGYVDTPVVQRTDLAAGATLTGPVIIEEFGSTVPIHPGFQVRVDEYLNLVVTRAEA